MTETFKSYRDLVVWQASVQLAVDCYEYTRYFPSAEAFGMTSQIRRSATSIAANIAEGYGRDGASQFHQFLKIAQGSLKELETHITISNRVGLLADEHERQLLMKCEEIGKMLRSLIRNVAARR